MKNECKLIKEALEKDLEETKQDVSWIEFFLKKYEEGFVGEQAIKVMLEEARYKFEYQMLKTEINIQLIKDLDNAEEV